MRAFDDRIYLERERLNDCGSLLICLVPTITVAEILALDLKVRPTGLLLLLTIF